MGRARERRLGRLYSSPLPADHGDLFGDHKKTADTLVVMIFATHADEVIEDGGMRFSEAPPFRCSAELPRGS
jgi:hypothetical protein